MHRSSPQQLLLLLFVGSNNCVHPVSLSKSIDHKCFVGIIEALEAPNPAQEQPARLFRREGSDARHTTHTAFLVRTCVRNSYTGISFLSTFEARTSDDSVGHVQLTLEGSGASITTNTFNYTSLHCLARYQVHRRTRTIQPPIHQQQKCWRTRLQQEPRRLPSAPASLWQCVHRPSRRSQWPMAAAPRLHPHPAPRQAAAG